MKHRSSMKLMVEEVLNGDAVGDGNNVKKPNGNGNGGKGKKKREKFKKDRRCIKKR